MPVCQQPYASFCMSWPAATYNRLPPGATFYRFFGYALLHVAHFLSPAVNRGQYLTALAARFFGLVVVFETRGCQTGRTFFLFGFLDKVILWRFGIPRSRLSAPLLAACCPDVRFISHRVRRRLVHDDDAALAARDRVVRGAVAAHLGLPAERAPPRLDGCANSAALRARSTLPACPTPCWRDD